MSMKFELHIHTPASDGYLNWDFILKRHARKNNLILGITDHNTMKYAFKLSKEIPLIMGEEISVRLENGTKGDVIGLFLQEEIKPLLSLGETIDLIREQAGLVYVPHPLDEGRHCIGGENAKLGDVVEIFNAKSPKHVNEKTSELFKDFPYKAVGTDAHFFTELGLTRMELPYEIDLDNPKEFLKSLKDAQFQINYPNPATDLLYKAIRGFKRWRKKAKSMLFTKNS